MLNRLWEEEGLHQNELAERARKDKHNIARILKLLERNGYIFRRSDPDDRRLSRVYLTSEGRALEEQLIPIVVEYGRKCFAGLSAQDLETLRRLHRTIIDNAENIKKQPSE